MSGTLKDPSGAVIPRVMLTLTNALMGLHFQAVTDQNGSYSFPSLPVGRYDLKIEATGFMPYKRNDLVVGANSAIKLDIAMEMGEKLRLELHQCGSSAIRHAVHLLRGRTSSRATFSSELPPLNASATHPNANIDFSPFLPQAGMTAPTPSNTYPYNENYFFSVERDLWAHTLLSLSYVGSQAHHLLVIYSANPGNPALCLALSQPSAVAPGSPTCGAFGEDTTYVTAAGKIVNGPRGPLGPDFHNDDYDASIGNSNHNSLQAGLRHSGPRLDLMLAYTFSKSMGSGLQYFRPAESFQLPLDARPLGLGSHPQSGRDLPIPTADGSCLRLCQTPDRGVGDFRNHAAQFGLSRHHLERR